MTITPDRLTGPPECAREERGERPAAHGTADVDEDAAPTGGNDSRLQGMLTHQEMVLNVLGLSMHALRTSAASHGGARW